MSEVYSASSTVQCNRCLRVVGNNTIAIDNDGLCRECHIILWDRKRNV